MANNWNVKPSFGTSQPQPTEYLPSEGYASLGQNIPELPLENCSAQCSPPSGPHPYFQSNRHPQSIPIDTQPQSMTFAKQPQPNLNPDRRIYVTENKVKSYCDTCCFLCLLCMQVCNACADICNLLASCATQ
ncbi:uncharacterized protein LOC129569717 [Sitodiplosis mosellana]|uniref:uncharacterized protein LOC129569717 n=1 Tax=Sitodiplosis mosellana TaxID=263140 RepID=UPI002444A287|nr:uncharacterized protein LOC129569717 [Sitodiplosis mosellana]